MRFLQGLLGEGWAEPVANTFPELTADGMRDALLRLDTLEGDLVRLRLPRLSDAGDLYTFARDEENSRHVLWEPHRSVSDSREVLRYIIRRNRKGLPMTLAITLKRDDRLIGTIGFQWINFESRSGEIGYSIARRLWNRGLATDALKTILPFAFDTLGLNRIEAKHDTGNPASGRVMEHAGFKLEGIARKSLLLKGMLVDVVNYALIREEWSAATDHPGCPSRGV